MNLGIALIGYGGVGRVHAMAYRNLAFHYGLAEQDARIVAVATGRAQTAQQAAREIGCPVFTDDYRTLLERDDVHALDVCVPNDLHEEVVLAAARAGKHVYCEKPLAINVAQAQRMVEAAERAGVKGQVVFNYRFLPALVYAKRWIAEGGLGRVFSFSGCYRRSSYIDPKKPLSWRLQRGRAGGGALFDLGSHLVDLVHHLLGEIVAVEATLKTLIDRRPVAADASEFAEVDVDDWALLQVRLNDGASGVLEVSRLATGSTNQLRLEVFGERGALRFDLQNPNRLEVYDAQESDQPLRDPSGWRRIDTLQRYAGQLAPDWTSPVGFTRAHAESQYGFLSAIHDQRQPEPSLWEGLRVQRVLDAALVSANAEGWVALG